MCNLHVCHSLLSSPLSIPFPSSPTPPPPLSATPPATNCSEMSGEGPVSLARAPMLFDSSQRSENFGSIRNTFEQVSKSLPTTPTSDRARSSKSPSPPKWVAMATRLSQVATLLLCTENCQYTYIRSICWPASFSASWHASPTESCFLFSFSHLILLVLPTYTYCRCSLVFSCAGWAMAQSLVKIWMQSAHHGPLTLPAEAPHLSGLNHLRPRTGALTSMLLEPFCARGLLHHASTDCLLLPLPPCP